MSKFFAGNPPPGSASLLKTLTVVRSGTLGTTAGIAGVEDQSIPANWSLEKNLEKIVFDSRVKYLRRLFSYSGQVSLPSRGAATVNASYLLGTIDAEFSNSFCLGEVNNSGNFGIYAGLCTGSGTRFLSFASTSVLQGNGLYRTSLYLMEQYGGQSASSSLVSVNVKAFVV